MFGGRWARSVAGAAVVALSLTVTACGGSDGGSGTESSSGGKGQLVINSFGGAWGDAIQLGFVDGFERETGIDVKLLSTADAAKSKLAVESGNEPPEDILDYDYATAAGLDKAGLLAPIDYGLWDKETLANVPANARHEFGVQFGRFALGICFDKRKFPDDGPQPAGWADFWDVESFPGKRGMLAWSAAEQTPEFSLLADGVAPADLYPIDLESSLDKLREVRPNVTEFTDNPAILQQQLLDGTVSMEVCFTHRVQKLIDSGADYIGISFDQSRLQGDEMFVWENAPNKENAMKFIAYIMQAQPQATWARIGSTGPVNEGAFELIPKEVAAKLPTSPENSANSVVKDDAWYASEQDGKPMTEVLVESFDEWQKEG